MKITRQQRNQLAFLGAAILSPKTCRDSVLRLYPVEFEDGPLRRIFTAIRQLMRENKAVDVISVENIAGTDCRELIIQAAETTPTVSHVQDYEALIVEDYRCAALREACTKLLTGSDSSDAMCAELRKQLDKQDRIRNTILDESAREFNDILDETVRSLAQPDTSLKLGWRDVDQFGLFERGNAVVIAGRPGGGKTDFSVSLAARFSRNYRVYYLTMEETRRKLMARIISRCTRIDSGRIRDRALSPAELTSIQNTANLLKGHHNMIIDDAQGITVDGIRAKLLRHKPDIAFIDHIGLIAGTDPKQKDVERLTEITRELKIAAMQMNIVVVEISQLNRQVDKTGGVAKSKLADLRGSGTIEQDANSVLYVENQPGGEEDEPLRGADAYKDVPIRVGKNRDGRTGRITMRWQPQYHSWEPAPDPAEDLRPVDEPLPDAVQQQFDAMAAMDRRLGGSHYE